MQSRSEPFLSGADAARVRRVLYLNRMPAEEIEDAMQEIELRAIQRPPRGSSRGAWACSVATNLALDRGRRAARQRRQPFGEPRASSEDMPGVELRDALRRGLDGLDATLRATIVLRFYADLTIAEIAATMDVPEGTVKSRLHRAVSGLRALLPAGSLR
jgi:RNA polymerase sigma-70 factor (ECF subfamily)